MSIVSSKVKIYSNSALTNLVATVNGTTSLTQTLTVTGLNSSTTYWAVAEATDNNNLTGYSVAQMFTTAAASYIFSNYFVHYESSYDTLEVGVDVSGPTGATFTECGVQFCESSDFSGRFISASNTSGAANFFSGDVTGFSENTTYYYRFFATTTQYGTQYYAPSENSITTHYDEPTLTCGIENGTITDTNATAWINYVGNYPVTNLHLWITPQGGTAENIQITNMSGLQSGIDLATELGHPLTPNTTYILEADADFYTGEVTYTYTFTTLGARPSVAITGVSNITPSGADVGISIS